MILVMAGLVPAIHVLYSVTSANDVDRPACAGR